MENKKYTKEKNDIVMEMTPRTHALAFTNSLSLCLTHTHTGGNLIISSRAVSKNKKRKYYFVANRNRGFICMSSKKLERM